MSRAENIDSTGVLFTEVSAALAVSKTNEDLANSERELQGEETYPPPLPIAPKGTTNPRGARRSRRETRLLPIEALGFGTKGTGNMIIHGSNISAVSTLRQTLRGRVRCVYLDPPYNNQEKYRHYDDRASREGWLADLTARIAAFFQLLSEDGSLWISIDDREMHYLKVAVDQIFGKQNFVFTIVWQQRLTRENRRVFSNNHEYLLVYARNIHKFTQSRNLLSASPHHLARYRNPDNDPRGAWQSISANVQDGHSTPSQHYDLAAPSGRVHRPPKGRCWAYAQERMKKEIQMGNIWFGKDGEGVPRIKKFASSSQLGLTPETLWQAADVGTTNEAKRQLMRLLAQHEVFDTPKPERLIERILTIATKPGDWVVDPYLGSGTTAAVAHKLGRKYVGIESGAHAITHCASRLRAVVEGEQSGISPKVSWKGGGGFDFLTIS